MSRSVGFAVPFFSLGYEWIALNQVPSIVPWWSREHPRHSWITGQRSTGEQIFIGYLQGKALSSSVSTVLSPKSFFSNNKLNIYQNTLDHKVSYFLLTLNCPWNTGWGWGVYRRVSIHAQGKRTPIGVKPSVTLGRLCSLEWEAEQMTRSRLENQIWSPIWVTWCCPRGCGQQWLTSLPCDSRQWFQVDQRSDSGCYQGSSPRRWSAG